MSFKPHRDKIQFIPLEKDTPFAMDEQQLAEAGTVVAVGEDVVGVQPGDVIFFLGYGAWKTSEHEGASYWVVPNRDEFILGKYVAEE